MPTYEYACPHCGIVEVFQSIKEAALTKCPQCKKRKVTRMVSRGGGVIFKGSGFWETDYNRSADYQSKSKAEGGDQGGDKPAESSPASAPKTEAKPQKVDGSAKPAPASPAEGGAKSPATKDAGSKGKGPKTPGA